MGLAPGTLATTGRLLERGKRGWHEDLVFLVYLDLSNLRQNVRQSRIAEELLTLFHALVQVLKRPQMDNLIEFTHLRVPEPHQVQVLGDDGLYFLLWAFEDLDQRVEETVMFA